jgi:hypothetical protein
VEAAMPIARHIFGRDKPSLTCLVHGGTEPAELRRALGLQQVFHPRYGKRHFFPRNRKSAQAATSMGNVWQAVLAVIAILDRTAQRMGNRRAREAGSGVI